MEEIVKFKHLLEYFVAHLSYVGNGYSKDVVGYDQYIKPIEPFDGKHTMATGQGYEGDRIQKQIQEWEEIDNHIIRINVQPNFGSYASKKCYLNWEHTGINIFCNWNNNTIDSISIGYGYWWNKPTTYNIIMTKSVAELGLFTNDTNSALDELYNRYVVEINDYDDGKGLYYQEEYEYYKKNKTMEAMKKIEPYVVLLKNNHNLILTGAPGTGKTYLAKQIAQQMIFDKVIEKMNDEEQKQFNEQTDFVQFHPSYDYTDFVEGLRPTPPNEDGNVGFERKDGVFKEFCERALKSQNGNQQIFNFDDAYKSFVDEIIENGGSIEFETPVQKKKFNVRVNRNGNLVAIPQTEAATEMSITQEMLQVYMESGKIIDWKPYVTAIASYVESRYGKMIIEKMPDKTAKFVFIIDEINRGEINKIFGELFFAIDPGYRGLEKCNDLRTQYANLQKTPNVFDDALNITDSDNCGHFFVPENVYIIGTMNDIDRSVESMDFAFRRRFAFKEVTADDSKAMLDDFEWKDDAVKRMDSLNAAIEEIEGLSSAYHIGASYFLKLRNYNGDFGQLWDCHLKGLLFEYLRGTQSVGENMRKLEKAYNLNNTAADDSDTDN